MEQLHGITFTNKQAFTCMCVDYCESSCVRACRSLLTVCVSVCCCVWSALRAGACIESWLMFRANVDPQLVTDTGSLFCVQRGNGNTRLLSLRLCTVSPASLIRIRTRFIRRVDAPDEYRLNMDLSKCN